MISYDVVVFIFLSISNNSKSIRHCTFFNPQLTDETTNTLIRQNKNDHC